VIVESLANTFAKIFMGKQEIPACFKHKNMRQLSYLAIDLELTELNTRLAKITSIAHVKGKLYDLDLASAYYQIVRTKGDLKQSPVIHGLLAKDVAKGAHVKEPLSLLSKNANDSVWVFHNADLDLRIIKRVWDSLELPKMLITYVDTMLLQVYLLEKTYGYVPRGEVTLGKARSFHHLMQAPEHNALDDAVSTLTLLFAQLYQLDKNAKLKLTDLAHTKSLGTFQLG